MEETTTTCILCDRQLACGTAAANDGDAYLVTCSTCGKYRASRTLIMTGGFDESDVKSRRYLLSAWTKAAHQPPSFDQDAPDNLRNGFPRERTVSEKIELMLRWFTVKSTELGDEVGTEHERDYPCAWCRSDAEWRTLLSHLEEDLGVIKVDSSLNAESIVSVTMRGWQWLDEQPKASGAKVFIAMAFHSSLDPVKATIEGAIRGCGL